MLARAADAVERLGGALDAAVARAALLEGPLASRATSAAGELRAIGAQEADLRRSVADGAERVLMAERRANGRSASSADGDPEALRTEAELSAERAAAAAEASRAAGERAAAAARVLAESQGREPRRVDALLLVRLAASGGRVTAALTVDVARFEAPLHARVEAGATRTAALGAELRRLGGEEVELRGALSLVAERVAAVDVELARVDAEREDAERRLERAAAEPAEGDDREELAARVERLERRREQLGQVNPLAKEEYAAEKERLEELSAQRADLERSLE